MPFRSKRQVHSCSLRVFKASVMRFILACVLACPLSAQSPFPQPLAQAVQVSPPTSGVPLINSAGIVNAASFAPSQLLVAGSIASLFGTGLAASTESASSTPLQTELGSTRVLVNGIPAPLFYVSPTQINFQIPFELQGQAQANVTVSAANLASNALRIALSTGAPGIFSVNQSGTGQGAILIGNSGMLAAQSGAFRNARPVQRGETISIFCTGLGAVSNQPLTGSAPDSARLSSSTGAPRLTVGGAVANVTFAGLAPGFVGLYQVNAEVPVNAPIGSSVLVQLNAEGILSNLVTISVEN